MLGESLAAEMYREEVEALATMLACFNGGGPNGSSKH